MLHEIHFDFHSMFGEHRWFRIPDTIRQSIVSQHVHCEPPIWQEKSCPYLIWQEKSCPKIWFENLARQRCPILWFGQL